MRARFGVVASGVFLTGVRVAANAQHLGAVMKPSKRLRPRFVFISSALPVFLAALGIGVAPLTYAADQGTTMGVASFQAKGEAKNHKPAVTVWTGSFSGVSVMDARKGPLHNAGWDCTGEVVIQDGNVYGSGGFCLVTDPDGDTINLLWQRTDIPGPAADGKTKGTYLSGTGKYSGIQGHYTFSCRQNGVVCNVTGGEYKIP